MDLDAIIRDIPDFPKEGIVFKDITPLLKDPAALQEVHSKIAEHFKDKKIDVIAGAESRGFIFGMGVAMLMKVGFVLSENQVSFHTIPTLKATSLSMVLIV